MRTLLCSILVVGLAIFSGCNGGDTEGVTGTVTLDGQPLADAEVTFTPEGGGRPASSMTDAAGNFELVYTVGEKGAPPGNYVVRIRTATTQSGPDGEDIRVPEKVPPQYNDRTELVREVKDGEKNEFTFDLQSP